MLQQQQESGGVVPPLTASSDSHLVTIECVDGSVVQLEAHGTDTVAEIRRIALSQVLDGGSAQPDSTYIVLAGDRIVDPATTVDEILKQEGRLQLNLTKPGDWGREVSRA